MNDSKSDQAPRLPKPRPEDVIYETCYAPVDLSQLLASAETRSKIRRLPGPQLYFGLQELSDEETVALLPHITEEQWQAVMDLDLWSRDRVRLEGLAGWHRLLLQTPDPVARKLLRGTDPELWQLLFRRKLRVYRRLDDEFEEEPREDEEYFTTPDLQYLVILPRHPELARLLRPLLERLYRLQPEETRLNLESAVARTSIELEEEAYEQRKRRIEDLGFQDYINALSVYAYLDEGEKLPEKAPPELREISTLPVRAGAPAQPELLLFRVIDGLQSALDRERLLEEISFVCNKVLSADGASPSSRRRLELGIRKAISGINLGLDHWSAGELAKAAEGVRRHYLQSFFQYGYSRLMDLQRWARRVARVQPPSPGSFAEALLEGLLKRFPLRTVRTPKGQRRRFVRTRRELEICRKKLDRIADAD